MFKIKTHFYVWHPFQFYSSEDSEHSDEGSYISDSEFNDESFLSDSQDEEPIGCGDGQPREDNEMYGKTITVGYFTVCFLDILGQGIFGIVYKGKQ